MTSIIIPAYNAEKYLQAAIDSVISQSDPDWELILVDDGSTDATGRICDNAASSEKRIQVIHTPNRGVSAARNAGIDRSSGDFLAFLDADDTFDADFIKVLKGVHETTGCGIIAAPFNHHKTNGGRLAKIITIPRSEALLSLFYQTKIHGTDQILDTSICSKLYRRDLWKDMRFREGRRFEDLEIFHRLVDKTDSIAFVGSPLYFYRNNSESFINTYSESRLDVVKVTDEICRHYARKVLTENEEFPVLQAARTRRFAAHCNIYLLLLQNGMHDQEIKERCLKVIKEERGMVVKNTKARIKDRAGAFLSYLLFC